MVVKNLTIRHGIALAVSTFALLTIVFGSRPASRLAASPVDTSCERIHATTADVSNGTVRPG